MITTDLVFIAPVGGGMPLDGPMTRERAEAWFESYRRRGNRGPCTYEIVPQRLCECCGEHPVSWINGQHFRCRKHMGRNPCAVEGCKRSTQAASRLSREWWLCQEHWRLGCRPQSAERKVIRRLWRLLKRCDWQDDELRVREDRIWRQIVSRARARARGDIDMDEINKIMGWN